MFVITASNKITKQTAYLMDFDLLTSQYVFAEDEYDAYQFDTKNDAFQVITELKVLYPMHEFKIKQHLLYQLHS